jgi:CheY-like chemotaxis protein
MNEAKTILLIDDDPDFARAIVALLEDAGYRVHHATSGRQGIEMARSLRPALILLDVMMAERTEGFFVLQEIRRAPDLAATPVVVVSSIYAEEPRFRVSPQAGWLPAELFLPKPVDPVRLLEAAARLCAAPVAPAAAGERRP